MQSIYIDPETGRSISTQSMLKSFRRCPKQAQYKYVDRLKPKQTSRPLREGDWGHKCLEAYFRGENWRTVHDRLTHQFGELFDEERDDLGDMPRNMERLLLGYFWHYQQETWTVHDVEFTLEAELPDGTIFRVKIDLLVENEFGLWLVDHKFNKNLPSLNFRLLDIQSPLYVWAAIRNKIPVQGFIWNYVRRKAPTVPQLTKTGRLSLRKVDTDYPTLVRTIKEHELRPKLYREWLDRLKAQQYRHGQLQTSPFFQRRVIERDPAMLKHFAREALHTSKRMHAYPFENVEIVERVPDRSCDWMCSYTDICTAEAFGGDTRLLRRQRYETVDPMYYYNDDPKVDTGKE